jgi:hypothetical protein
MAKRGPHRSLAITPDQNLLSENYGLLFLVRKVPRVVNFTSGTRE